MTVFKFTTYTDFWRGVVEPDYNQFINKIDDLRFAFHAAISLFHTADWVYVDNETYIRANYTFMGNNKPKPVASEKDFANALRDLHPDFELIRQIANAAKHLKLKHPAKAHHTHAPSHAANTVVQSTAYGAGTYGPGPYGGTPRVMLEGPNGNDLEFSDIAGSVRQMWIDLAAEDGWTL